MNRVFFLVPLFLFGSGAAAQERGNQALLGVVAVQRGGETVVAAVLPKSPAEKAKLAAGDKLVQIDGAGVRSPKDVDRALSGARPKEKIEVVFERDGRKSTVTTRLSARADYKHDFLKRPPRGKTGFEAPAWHGYAWANVAEGEQPPTLMGAKGKVVVFHAFQSW